MLLLTASSFVIGALLGTKFRVFVLLPTILLGAAVISITTMFHPIAAICGEIISCAISLQLGYLVGAGTHHIFTGDHTSTLSTGTTLAPPAH